MRGRGIDADLRRNSFAILAIGDFDLEGDIVETSERAEIGLDLCDLLAVPLGLDLVVGEIGKFRAGAGAARAQPGGSNHGLPMTHRHRNPPDLGDESASALQPDQAKVADGASATSPFSRAISP